MSIDQAGLRAIADARTRSLTVDTRPYDIDPDAEARDHLRALGGIAPGPAVAEALLAVRGHGVVPIDRDSLLASGNPFPSYAAAAEHYQQSPHDGVGLELGGQPDGSTLVAVRATAATWLTWLAVHGSESRDIQDADGRVIAQDRSYLDPGRHVKVHWSPRGVSARVTPVAVGRAAIEREGESVRADRAGVGEVGWVAWAIGAAWSIRDDHGLRLAFKSHSLGEGVALLAEGVLPMAAARRDGWTLSCTGVPATLEPAAVPPWIIDTFDAKWVKA